MAAHVVYYSYSGITRRLALEEAESGGLKLTEVKDARRVGKLKAYLRGCFAAIRGGAWKICEVGGDYQKADRIILMFPIWAGNMPPAVNAFLKGIPDRADGQGEPTPVLVKAVSTSGKSACRERLAALLERKGYALEGFEDVMSKGMKA
ncbi:MAG: hypothetical protein FWE70_00995 [Oscillospiraceae bacterium]|nr:hypothetical protein [Oscillospiraceae bacterium]